MPADTATKHSFGYKPALDGVRALAVLGVIFYHLGYGWARGGFLGVDAFFALSGYLITSLLIVEWSSKRGIGLRAFWMRRARRLLPALLLVVLAVGIWANLVLASDQLGRIRSDGLATLFYSANWHFAYSGQSYFALYSIASPFRHAWSLAIEEQFYLVWPLVTLGCLRLARGRLRLLATVCVVGAAGSIAAMATQYSSADPSRAYYGTDARAHSLLIGALLAILLRVWSPRRDWTRRAVHVVGNVSFVLVIVAFVAIHDTSSWMYYGGFALFAVVVAAVLTSAVTPGLSPIRRVLSLPPLVWIGTISYGLYLWHWPVQIALNEGRTGLRGDELNLARIGATFAIATVSFYAVERPIRYGTIARAVGRRKSIVAAPIAVGAVVAALLVTTAGATAPPPQLRAGAGAVRNALANARKATPASSTTTTATAPGTPSTTPTSHPAPRSVVWAGDSVAYTLDDAVKREGASRGLTVTTVSAPGCGMITGLPMIAPGGNDTVSWAKTCDQNIPRIETEAVQNARPDIVTWLSYWDDNDRVIGDHVLRFGTDAGDAEFLGLVDQAVGRLTATGARVAFLTAPPTTVGTDASPDPVDVARTQHLDYLLRLYSLEHPATTFVVDLSAMVCPGGPPCPQVVGGVELRPRDGRHFGDAGAAWTAPRVLDALTTAATGS